MDYKTIIFYGQDDNDDISGSLFEA